MAKDYFQDILPPDNQPQRPAPPKASEPEPESEERSIRNVVVPNRMRPITSRETIPPPPPRTAPKHRSSLWIWVLACIVLIGAGGFFALSMRKTTITVSARTQPISFDQTYTFTAYPQALAASDTLPYLVQTFDFEDSEPVPSTGGAPQVDHAASGSITVQNDFSPTSVKLIKNTRFETPDHLIFRTPADIVVPGKKGSAPGTISITVVADAPGSRYNIAPTNKFTLPGLKSNAQMYAHVFAVSSAPMTGGSAANESGVDPTALQKAVATLRGRLQDKVTSSINSLASSSVALSGLAQTTYGDEPSTTSGTNVVVHQKVHVELPVFAQEAFAATVAKSASVDTQGVNALLSGLSGVSAAATNASSTLGVSPISFTIQGNSMLVWQIDAKGLATALASKDRATFQTIVNGFPAIQEAQARIEPFWSRTFPSDPSRMIINIRPLKQASQS